MRLAASGSLLSGSLAYCLRKTGAFCVIRRNEPPIRYSLAEVDEPGTVRHAETYGLSKGSPDNEFWISDKRNHRVLLVSLKDFGYENSFEVLRQVRDSRVMSPCTVDFRQDQGVLIAHYGLYSSNEDSGVSVFDRDQFIRLTPVGIGRVTHACWLDEEQFCFVTRHDSVLWIQDIGGRPTRLSRSGTVAPQMAGRTAELCLQYVQGLYYSQKKRALFVGDALLGAIFELSLNSGTYSVACGVPAISDSSWKSNVTSSDPKRWLGRIRAVSEDLDENLIWIDGATGSIVKFKDGQTNVVGRTDPDLRSVATSGCGLVVW